MVSLTAEQERALTRLVKALREHDSFGAVPDDTAAVMDHNDCYYELTYSENERWDILRLGDLRDLATIGQEESS